MENTCDSGVGRYDNRPTATRIGTACYTKDKIHNGFSWIVLHEVNEKPQWKRRINYTV